MVPDPARGFGRNGRFPVSQYIYGRYGAALPAGLPENERGAYQQWLESLGNRQVCNSEASEVPKNTGFNPQPVTKAIPNVSTTPDQWTKTP